MLTECLFFMLTTVGFYGIGLSRTIHLSQNMKGLMVSYMKSLMTSVATVALSYLLINFILVPAQLQELFPFVCVLIFAFISCFFELIVRLSTGSSAAEFAVSFLCVLLTINESLELSHAVLFVLCSLSCFYAIIPLLYALRKRNDFSDSISVLKNYLLLFSLAAVILCLLVFDVSWLKEGLLG